MINEVDGEGDNEQVGMRVALSNDGNTLAVGGNGTLKLYEQDSINTWTSTDLSSFDMDLVYGLSISPDGSWLIAGLPLVNSYAGGVLAFNKISQGWSKIGADIVGNYDYFGWSVDVSNDGTLSVGADGGDYVKIFHYVNGALNTVKVFNGESASWFGYSISMAGSMLAVGAPYYNNGTGAVFLYDLDSSTDAAVQQIDGNDQDEFGGSVSLSGNGIYMAAGAYNASYVNIYKFDTNLNQFIQIGDSVQGTYGTAFGQSISLSSDGNSLIVGAPYNNEGGYDTGRSFIYEINKDGWDILEEIKGEAPFYLLGNSVAISGNVNRVAIGGFIVDSLEVIGRVRLYEAVAA